MKKPGSPFSSFSLLSYCLYIFLTLGILSSPLHIQANGIWVGNGDGVSWDDPDNWQDNALPQVEDDILLPDGAKVTLKGSRLLVRSLHIDSGASLTINMTSTLSLLEASGNCLTIKGSLINLGTLFVNYAEGTGIILESYGWLENHGTLVVDDVQGPGLELKPEALLYNQASGSISIARSRAEGINIQAYGGKFHNHGVINIGACAKEGLNIGYKSAFFNHISGELNSPQIVNSGSFVNKGTTEVKDGGVRKHPSQQNLSDKQASIKTSFSPTQTHEGLLPQSKKALARSFNIWEAGNWVLMTISLGLLFLGISYMENRQKASLSTGDGQLLGRAYQGLTWRHLGRTVLICSLITALVISLGIITQFTLSYDISGGLFSMALLSCLLHVKGSAGL